MVVMNVLSGFCAKKVCPSQFMCRKGFSMCVAKRIVDRASPCGMPCVVGNGTDVVVPNLTDSWISDKKYCSIVHGEDERIGCRMPKIKVLSTVSQKWTTLVYLSSKTA